MNRMLIYSMILLLVAGAASLTFAAPAVIGIAGAQGGFVVDNAPVRGSTALFEGATLETSGSSSWVRLDGGAEVQLGSASRGRIFSDHLVLEKGQGQLISARHYRIDARGLRIISDLDGAGAYVAFREPGRVAVSALVGSVRVTTTGGILLARVEAGHALEFEPQAADASAPFLVTGCVAAADNRVLLKDTLANVTFELRGRNLSQYAGKQIEITATELKDVKPGEGAAQVIQVTNVRVVAGSCTMPVAAPQGSSSGSGGPKAVSKSGTKKAIIAGVVIAAAVGGATIGLTGNDSSKTISR